MRRRSQWLLWAASLAVYAFLYVPLAVVVIFSFNDSMLNAEWVGFTLSWYEKLASDGEMLRAAGNSLVMSGGTLDTGGLNQSLGTLDLDGTAAIDFGGGASAVSFASSSGIDWATFALNLSNWTVGVDSLRFGSDGSGLTAGQLNQVVFTDLGNVTAQIDSLGFITPAPEPSTLALGLLGTLGVWWRLRSRQAK